MKIWVLQANSGRYLCSKDLKEIGIPRDKYDILKENDIVFSFNKNDLQDIAFRWNDIVDKWNEVPCEAFHVNPVFIDEYKFDEVKEVIQNEK